jgi:hypothetical protein
MVESYPQRWAIETTFQACREYLKLASTTGSGQAPVVRLTPGLFGGYPALVLLSLHLPKPWSTRRGVCWQGNTTVTCAEMITWGRRAICEQWCVHTPADRQAFSPLSRSLQDMLL